MQNVPQHSCVPPPRQSSLASFVAASNEHPLPVPLSQMSIEKLMHILPTLNAAIIAHDWVPCMQKRQQELKSWLQNNKTNLDTTEELKALDDNLAATIDRSDTVAKTFHQLFDIAQKLQDRDDQETNARIHDAHAKTSRALVELTKLKSTHKETCAQHQRDMAVYKFKTRQAMQNLGLFVRQNLYEAAEKVSEPELQWILNIVLKADNFDDLSSTHIPAEIYQSLERTAQMAQDGRDDLWRMCLQQNETIQQQARSLDKNVARMARFAKDLAGKDQQVHELQAHVEELEMENQALSTSQKLKGAGDDSATIRPTPKDMPVLNDSFDEEVWTRDFEIANMRRKLDKAYDEKRELGNQIRQLLQASQQEQEPLNRPECPEKSEFSDKPPSRLKRLLGGPQKSSPGIPTMNSMQNISHAIAFPFGKGKHDVAMALSPVHVGKSSPGIKGWCDLGKIDHLELPPTRSDRQTSSRDFSPPQPPPRPRSTHSVSLDEIHAAVSGRFHQLPSHVQMNASTTRPYAPSNSSQSWYDEIPEISRQLRRRSNSNPDFGGAEASLSGSAKAAYLEGRTPDRYYRVLSGITEVTEDGGSSFKRKSDNTGSPDSADRRMYLDSLDAERAMKWKTEYGR